MLITVLIIKLYKHYITQNMIFFIADILAVWLTYIYIYIYSMVCLNTGFWLVGRYAVKPFNAQVVPSQFNHRSILMCCFYWYTITNTHHSHTHTQRWNSAVRSHLFEWIIAFISININRERERERERESEIADCVAHTHINLLSMLPRDFY